MNLYKVDCFDDYDYYSFDVLAEDKEEARGIAITRMSDWEDIIGYHIELVADRCTLELSEY